MTSVAVLDAMPSPWIWLMCCLRKLDENNWLDLMRITTLMLTFEFRITFSNVRLKRTHNGRSPYRCSLEILNAAGSNLTTLICAPTLFVVSLIIVNNYVRTFISLVAVWSFTLATLLGSLEVVENVVKFVIVSRSFYLPYRMENIWSDIDFPGEKPGWYLSLMLWV